MYLLSERPSDTLLINSAQCDCAMVDLYRWDVREVELWQRLDEVLPGGYAASWADQVALGELGSRTVREALADGIACKRIWRAVWRQLELPESKF